MQNILEEFQKGQEAKGFRPYDPRTDYESETAEDAEDEAPRDSALADAIEKGAAEHWKGTSVVATGKELPDGSFRTRVGRWLKQSEKRPRD